ncbi:hypothetical protein [Pedobacter metabolipauper]|uniref:Uncharacterized protein n=1 Tax=Pedobacter metabolipauper TaxID=425513 RepID=A0A4R6T3B0_9SPHI|nr:hypothetical protein [Pedobacter metabolipauper]TDQ12020.1 hypothetical protein ATK78_1150 [Pedobacter metabolipauper]
MGHDQKNIGGSEDPKKKYIIPDGNEENINLGLDADQSSEGDPLKVGLNDDNERISGNPDGEDDDSNRNDRIIRSPLDDK